MTVGSIYAEGAKEPASAVTPFREEAGGGKDGQIFRVLQEWILHVQWLLVTMEGRAGRR